MKIVTSNKFKWIQCKQFRMLFEIVLILYDYYYVEHIVLLIDFNKNTFVVSDAEDNMSIVIGKITTKQSKTLYLKGTMVTFTVLSESLQKSLEAMERK